MAPGRAAGQQTVALDRLEPAPAGDDFLAVASPGVPGELRLALGFVLSFARSPLLLVAGTDQDHEEVGELVDHQLVLHNLVSLELARRVKLELDLPATLSQGGDLPGQPGAVAASPSGATLNDIRSGVRVELLRQSGWWPAAALAVTTWFPSGDPDGYTSAGLVRYEPSLMLGASGTELAWAVRVGRRFQAYQPESAWLGGSELVFGAAAAGRIDWLQIGPELYASTVADEQTDAFSRRSTAVEALLAARASFGAFSVRLAGGPGLTSGFGTPRYRLVGAFAWSPESDSTPRHVRRRAEHGARTSTQSEQTAGAQGASVPPRPPVPRPPVPFATSPLEPSARPDRDGDGVADDVDACPDDAGPRHLERAHDGCPTDRDGDGIHAPADACPDDRGERADDPAKNGCPRLVRLVGAQIVIDQQVRFAMGRDEIDPTSAALLGEVAQLLADHPEIARVAVDGHTDDVGPVRANVELSQRRALAVVRWLNERGVDARRTEARGFGPHRPLASNRTADGRAQNRRVEFQVLRRTAEGEAGWRDGPVE